MNAKERGSIFILVFWALCFLATLAVIMSYGVRQKIRLLGHIESKDKLHFVAEAGVKKALAILAEDSEEAYDALKDPWSNNASAFKQIEVGDANFTVSYAYIELKDGEEKIRYGMIDEERKVNINTQYREDIMSGLFQLAAGLDSDAADDLAASIIDWKDKDSRKMSGGAEDYYYDSLISPYICKNDKFEVLDELMLVKGMTQEIFDKIKPFVTIYGGGKININTAGKDVLIALGLDEELTDKLLEYRCGDDKLEGTLDDNVFANPDEIPAQLSRAVSIDIDEMTKLTDLTAESLLTTTSNVFMVRSLAVLNKKDTKLQTVAVYNKGGGGPLYWRET